MEMDNKSASTPARRYKVVCIAQVFNEIRKGNLERFLAYTLPLVDDMVVYDDGSTDGTFEFLLETPVQVLRGARNDFADEIGHKRLLLERALTLKPDYILWLDADEVLSSSNPEELQAACAWCEANSLDGAQLHELNLWRSNAWRRIDSSYDLGWFVRLWKVTADIGYETTERGLHRPQYPSSIRRVERYTPLNVLHFGFADEVNLAHKYLVYRAQGQRGYEMLDRLISEEQLELLPVVEADIPDGLSHDDARPHPISFASSLEFVERYRGQVLRPGFSIICLVYKSVEWARFLYEQVLRYTDMADKEFFFVANDASDEVLEYLRSNYIPHFEWTNTEANRSEWYINNVYRAYNFGASVARGDFLVFLNTDMAFAPGWFEALWETYDGRSAVASRLVESGKLKSGTYGIERDFGSMPSTYREEDFLAFAEEVREPGMLDGGLFMPLLMRRDLFLEVGGYPEGNIRCGSDIFSPEIALQGESLVSGDNVLIQRLASRGVAHKTALDSVVYHFQEGEKDSSADAFTSVGPRVAVCNDLVTGTMGERVLWDFLLEGLPSSVGVDSRVVGQAGRYSSLARDYITNNEPQVEVIIQNATFIDAVDPARYTIAFLQDDLRAMGRDSEQQERVLCSARMAVTNSLLTAMSYPEYDFEIVPVGVDAALFRPMDREECRRRVGIGPGTVGIFVGAFDEVKGWPEVRRSIAAFPDVTWLLVTKKDETVDEPNARVFARVPQDELAVLLNCADFFILGSPVETQCLAAIEACLCDVPVVMHNTGIFHELSDEERDRAGVFGDDLLDGVRRVLEGHFSPRDLVLEKGWTVQTSVEKWRLLLQRAFQELAAEKVGYVGPQVVDETGAVVRRERTPGSSPYKPMPPRPSLLKRHRSWAAEDLAPRLKRIGVLGPALFIWRGIRAILRIK